MKCKKLSHGHITEVDALTCGYDREIERLKAQIDDLKKQVEIAYMKGRGDQLEYHSRKATLENEG